MYRNDSPLKTTVPLRSKSLEKPTDLSPHACSLVKGDLGAGEASTASTEAATTTTTTTTATITTSTTTATASATAETTTATTTTTEAAAAAEAAATLTGRRTGTGEVQTNGTGTTSVANGGTVALLEDVLGVLNAVEADVAKALDATGLTVALLAGGIIDECLVWVLTGQ